MSSTPPISLILCVKNGMPFLPEAIESVAAQSYRHFELIVQDGGSTDGSLEFLQGVGGIPSVQIRSQPDNGIGQAYNSAVHRCSGQIVGSIDADNLLEKDALEIVVDGFDRLEGFAALYGGSRMLEEGGQFVTNFIPSEFDMVNLLHCVLVPPFATSFFSRKVCGDDLRFDESLSTCADFDLWLRLGHLPIARLPVILGSTRISSKSMTCNPESYDQFCGDKIRALERYLAQNEGNLAIDSLRIHAISGIYAWAAESIYNLEGESEKFKQFCDKVAAIDPLSVRLRTLSHPMPSEQQTRHLKGRRPSGRAARGTRLKELLAWWTNRS